MTETELLQENPTKNIKFYSSRAIWGATFFGGPLAAGYMIGENFKSLDRPIEAKNSLIIGIISTIIIFVGVFLIPENIIEKIPRQIIPLVYTGIAWGIVEWKQGEILKSHKEKGNNFFSGWRAALIGLISLVVILIGLLGYIFFGPENEIYDKYDEQISVFSQNENETLVFYNHLDTETNQTLIQELENKTIPKWKENIQIINNLNNLENLPPELIEQNKILLKYSELRLETFELFKKAISDDTDKYLSQLEKLHMEIDEQLEKLN